MTLYLDSLKLKNYRQYKDATIEFSRESKKMFTVLRGDNGAGKTNVMNAITWCLYGRENHLNGSEDDRGQNRLPIVNKEVLRKTPDQERIRMYVELILADEIEPKIKIKRILTLYNNNKTITKHDKDVGAPIPMGSKPSVETIYSWYEPNEGGWETVYNTDFGRNIETLLPENLSMYYLFDGERLESFFQNVKNVKVGIENVTQIGVLQDAIVRLEKIRSAKIRNSKSIHPEVKRYDSRLNDIRERSNKINDEIKKLELKKITMDDQRSQITKHLKKFDGIREIINKEESLQVVINGLKKEHNETDANIRRHVLEYAGHMQARLAISKALRIIEEKVDAGILPPDINDTFLKKLLESNRCICGSNISMGRARDLVKKQLDKVKYTPKVSRICTTLTYELKKTEPTDVRTKLLDLEKKKDFLNIEIQEKADEHKQLKNKLKNVDKNRTNELIEERETLDVKINRVCENLGERKSDRKQMDVKLEDCERDLKLANKRSERRYGIKREVDFCTRSLDGLKAAQQKLITDVRFKVEKNTKKLFLNSIWKENSFNDVKINENYIVTAVDKYGHNVKEDLSSGEKMVLAFAFMAALRKVTDLKFPLIVDTPLGRISGKTRYKLANALPKALQGDQVVLFVTDAEYQAAIYEDHGKQKFPAIYKIINKYVGKDFDIIHDGESSEVRKRG